MFTILFTAKSCYSLVVLITVSVRDLPQNVPRLTEAWGSAAQDL